MRKRVGSHHRLVGLDHKTRGLGDQAGSRHDLRCVDAHLEPEVVTAGANRHDHLLQRAVAGTLPQPVDGAFHLAGAADHHPGQ